MLAFASVAPAAIVAGLSVTVTGRYRPQMWMGWILTIISLGLMTTVLETDSLAKPIGYLLLLGVGTGYVMFVDPCSSCTDTLVLIHDRMLHPTSTYPIQAPLPVKQNAPSLAFMWFLCSFATVSTSTPHIFRCLMHCRCGAL